MVPDSKLVVARTAFRDNSSFYTVNGRRTQFKAVARLLRAQGIDLDHNRFLILQVRWGGDADRSGVSGGVERRGEGPAWQRLIREL